MIRHYMSRQRAERRLHAWERERHTNFYGFSYFAPQAIAALREYLKRQFAAGGGIEKEKP